MNSTKDESQFWDTLVMRWDICPHFHGMTDTGYGNGPYGFSRPRTYTGECYAQLEGQKCKRKGKCVVRRGLK